MKWKRSILGTTALLLFSPAALAENPTARVHISTDETQIKLNHPVPVRIEVKNLSDTPITYITWSCPENGNFQSQSECFSVDPGNVNCDKNVPTKVLLSKNQPLRKELKIHLTPRCKETRARLKIRFLEDGGIVGGNSKFISDSNEITFSVLRK